MGKPQTPPAPRLPCRMIRAACSSSCTDVKDHRHPNPNPSTVSYKYHSRCFLFLLPSSTTTAPYVSPSSPSSRPRQLLHVPLLTTTRSQPTATPPHRFTGRSPALSSLPPCLRRRPFELAISPPPPHHGATMESRRAKPSPLFAPFAILPRRDLHLNLAIHDVNPLPPH